MATGPEHYYQAEEHIESANAEQSGSNLERYHLAAAQAHATLALAAATALNIKTPGLTTTEYDAWHEVAGTEPAP